MRKLISELVLGVATFMLLLMSAIPHHHHCTEPDGTRHVDFICFSSPEEDGEMHDCGHDGSGEEEVHLHSIVTVSERTACVQPSHAMPFGRIPSAETIPDAVCGKSEVHREPLLPGTYSSFHPRIRGLRAPPCPEAV